MKPLKKSPGTDAAYYIAADRSAAGIAARADLKRLMDDRLILMAALWDLREACTEAYKAGRVAAEPFVRAGNVYAQAMKGGAK